MGLSARRLALVALLVVVLAGCRIDVILHQHGPLPEGVEWDVRISA